MKKIILSVLSVVLLTGCSSSVKSNSDNTTDFRKITSEASKSYKFEEFYEKKEFDAPDYLYVEDMKYSPDGFLRLCGTMTDSSDNSVKMISSDNTMDINISIPDLCPVSACLYNNSLYISDFENIYIQNTESNKYQQIEINEPAKQIQHNDKFIYLFSFDGTLSVYTPEMSIIKSINPDDLKSKLGCDTSGFSLKYFLVMNNKYYFFGDSYNPEFGNDSAILKLYCTDSNYNTIFEKTYSDMSGLAFGIFRYKDDIMIVSNYTNEDFTEFTSYTDIISAESGDILNWYEFEDSTSVLPGPNEECMIVYTNHQYYSYNLATGAKETAVDAFGFNEGDLYYDNNSFISFSDTEYNLTTVFSETTSDIYNSFIAEDENISSSGISCSGSYYSLSYNDAYDTLLTFYGNNNEYNQVILKNNDSTEMLIPSSKFVTDNRIYIVSYNEISACDNVNIYDFDGTLLNTIQSPSEISDITGNSNKQYCITYDDTLNSIVYEIANNEFTDIPVLDNFSIDRVYDGDDIFDFYFYSGTDIYGYSSADSTLTKILNCINSGIANVPEYFVKYINDDYLCYCDSELFHLHKADEETLKALNSRDIITIAGNKYSLSSGIASRITDFNSLNREYYISYIDYTNNSFQNDTGSRLYNDIIKGEVPDIYILDSLDEYAALKSMNAFKDISSHIIDNPDYKDIFVNVFKAYSDSEKQYAAASGFTYSGILYDSEINAFGSNYTYENFIDTVTSQNLKFRNCTPEELYYYFVIYHWNDFIDKDNKTCSFDSPLFLSLLNLIRNACDEDGELSLVNIDSLYSLRSICSSENEYLFDVSFDNSRNGILMCREALAVSSVSECQEGIMQFIDMFADFEYQKTNHPFIPVDKKVFLSAESIYSSDDSEAITRLIDSSESVSLPEPAVLEILLSDMYNYIDGNIQTKEYAAGIQHQMTLMLNELY